MKWLWVPQWSLSELDGDPHSPQLPHRGSRQVLRYPMGYLPTDYDWYPHHHSAPLPPLQLFSVTAKDRLVMDGSGSLPWAGSHSTSHRLQSGNGEGSTGMYIGTLCAAFCREGLLCRLCSPLSLVWVLIHAPANCSWGLVCLLLLSSPPTQHLCYKNKGNLSYQWPQW